MQKDFWGQDADTREKQFCECLKNSMEKRSRYLSQAVLKEYTNHKEKVTDSFLMAFQTGGRQLDFMIASGLKSKIQYIHLSYLLSGALTEKYELKIDFYDQRYFGDLEEVDCFWDYHELFPMYPQELLELKVELQNCLPRLTAYEIQRAKLYYQVGNFAVLEPIIQDLLRNLHGEDFLTEYMDSQVNVFYGAYLDQAKRIDQWRR